MKEIRINGSKLKLVDFTNYETFAKSDAKFRYKLGIICYPDTIAVFVPYKAKPEDIREGYTNFYGLVFGDRKYTAETYDYEEKTLLSQVMGILLHLRFIDTAEIICRALKSRDLASKFYSAYGENLKNLTKELIKSPACDYKEETVLDPKTYHQGYRYSICNLVDDLIRAKAWIYTDPELIGSYKRISREVKDGSEFIPDKWSEIIGKQGNKTRANLSIAYAGNVTVDVPENDLGIEPGPRELKASRSFCLVRDGRVWMKKIGVRVDEPWLVRRLYSAKIVECKLIYDNEYLLDLSKLRVITKDKLRGVDSYSMAKYEVGTKLSSIALSYYSKRKYMLEKGIAKLDKKIEEITPEEQFLHGLGIYGDTYYPQSTVLEKPEETYLAYEVIGYISGLPTDIYGPVRTFLNTGKSRNKVICEFLKTLPVANTPEECAEYIRLWERRQKTAYSRLRSLKFRLIMGKTMKFWEHGMPNVEGMVKKFSIGPAENNVSVSWKVIESTVTI